MRSLEKELGESLNAIRVELNRLEKAELLITTQQGNRKYYCANTAHPIFSELNSILQKMVGIDQLNKHINCQILGLEQAYITGDFANGHNFQITDLVLIGQNLDNIFISELILKTASKLDRKIRYLVLTCEQMDNYFHGKPVLLIWEKDKE